MDGADHGLALRGKAGVANARLAFQMFEDFFSGELHRIGVRIGRYFDEHLGARVFDALV